MIHMVTVKGAESSRLLLDLLLHLHLLVHLHPCVTELPSKDFASYPAKMLKKSLLSLRLALPRHKKCSYGLINGRC